MFSTIEGRRRVSSSTVDASVALIALSDDERTTQAHIQHVSYVLVTPKITTHLTQLAMPRHNRRSTGALKLRRKWECCRLLPVLAGAQTRRSPAQLQWTSRICLHIKPAFVDCHKTCSHWLYNRQLCFQSRCRMISVGVWDVVILYKQNTSGWWHSSVVAVGNRHAWHSSSEKARLAWKK